MNPINDVIYDGFSFMDNGIVFTNIDHLTLAPRENQLEKLANRNGAKLVQSNIGTKPIYLEGYYQPSSIIDAQNMYDTLAQALNRQERPLDIPHAGGSRRYIATPQNIIIKQPNGLNRLTFSFEFVVPEGSSEDTSTTTLIDDTITTATSTIALSVLGSVQARPFITLEFTSVTGGTSKTVTVRNARDFIGLSIERTFTTGDIITIDSDEFQIYINGVLTEPSGRFPTWAPGPGSLYYSDTFTDREVDITATYKKRNL